jgi:two-component system cell cycle sensor histidine kinase/response regulator CckA
MLEQRHPPEAPDRGTVEQTLERADLPLGDRRINDAARAASEALWDYDIATGAVWWSEGLTRLFGFALATVDLTFDWWERRIHPDDRERVVESIREALDDGSLTWTAEYRFVGSDDVWVFVLDRASIVRTDAGVPVRMFGSLVDITEKMRAEEALRHSEERFRSLVANIPEVVWTADENGNATFISPNIVSLIGFTQEEIYREGERLWYGRIHPDDVGRVREAYARLFSTGDPFDVEYRIRHKNGAWIWWHDRAVATHVRDGARFADGLLSDVTKRKRAEEALRASEARFAVAFNAMPHASAIAELRSGRFVNVNEAFVEQFGYTRDEVVGRSSLDLGIWERAEDRTRVVTAIEAGKVVRNFQSDVRTKAGELRSVILSFSTIDVDGEQCLLTVSNDVTERIRAQEAMVRREAQMRRLVDANLLGIFFSDFSGAITYANDAFLRIIGYSRQDLVAGNLNWRTITPSEYWPASDRADEEARQRGVYEPFEKEYIRGDGTRIPVLVGGAIFEDGEETGYGIDFVLDLTERKRAEHALRDSEARYRSMFESDLSGNYVTTPGGKLLACNEAFATMHGFSSIEEAMGCSMSSLYAQPESRNVFIDLLRQEKRLARYEFEARTRDGATLHTIDFAEGVFDDAGELVEIRGSCFDDTKRRLLEEQLHQSQKMEAVGRLAGGIAHDFNNLLTVIAGYSDIMLRHLSTSDPLYCDAREIRQAAERAAGLTRQLLAFSRKQVLQPKVLNLNELLDNMQRMLRRLIGENVELDISLDRTLPNVQADPGQLEQVVVNLVVNACDAMPDGGRLAIATSTEWSAPAATTANAAEPTRCVLLSVSDTGCGMDEETRTHVFEPFFTTKESGKGTGLGLATVYGIVRQSRGSIDVASEPGCGATFRMYLPAVEAKAEASPSHEESGPSHRGTETILLVEDEDSVRKLAVGTLRQCGYKVLEARGGGEALLASEQFDGRIDLVLSDVVMPQMNGRVLVERLKASRTGLKALYMSGYTDDEVLRHGVYDEGTGFIAKPFMPGELAKIVREILDGD